MDPLLPFMFILAPLPGSAVAIWLRPRLHEWRWPLLLSASAFLAVGFALAAVVAYPGPDTRYAIGTLPWIIREWLVIPAGLMAFAWPSLIALVIVRLMPLTVPVWRVSLMAVLAGYLCLLATVLALLVISCGLTGDCG
jgi:hypothetical protein